MDEDTIPDYDGFYFLPETRKQDGDGVAISFFKFTEPEDVGEKMDNNSAGDMYHVAFFVHNTKSQGGIDFDGNFEGIFVDPVTYVKHTAFGNLGGCFVRKTTKSTKWFTAYLEGALANLKAIKLADAS